MEHRLIPDEEEAAIGTKCLANWPNSSFQSIARLPTCLECGPSGATACRALAASHIGIPAISNLVGCCVYRSAISPYFPSSLSLFLSLSGTPVPLSRAHGRFLLYINCIRHAITDPSFVAVPGECNCSREAFSVRFRAVDRGPIESKADTRYRDELKSLRGKFTRFERAIDLAARNLISRICWARHPIRRAYLACIFYLFR